MAEGIIQNIDDFVRLLLSGLNDCNIEYVLIGGIAATHYGRPRSTLDCDIIISLDEEEIASFCKCLDKNGFNMKETDIRAAFNEKSHFTVFYKDHYGYRADFSFRRGSLAEHSFIRAKKKEIFGVRTLVTSPEDLIIAKLVYGSYQDLDDALAIILRQKDLDLEYLEKRATEEGVLANFKKLIKESKK